MTLTYLSNTTVGKAFCDCRLYGEFLTRPLKWCAQYVQATWAIENRGVKKSLQMGVVSVAMVPAAAVATIGTAAKWVDLKCRSGKLQYKGLAITYFLPFCMERVSRLGDRLFAYLQTKNMSLKYKIPMYFRTFQGAEFFRFSTKEEEGFQQDLTKPEHFKRTVYVNSEKELEALVKKVDRTESVLIVLSYFADAPIQWQTFTPIAKGLLKVVQTYRKIAIPPGFFSIALHIRTGGTYDAPDVATMLPKKLPPLQFYSGELNYLIESSHLPKDKSLFVHIFTDDVDPKKVCQKLQQQVKGKVTWSYNESPALIDDVANMSRFDGLIRPQSNLSGTLARIADHTIEICPAHFTVNATWTHIIIDGVERRFGSSPPVKAKTDYHMPVVKKAYLPLYFYKWFHRTFNKSESSAKFAPSSKIDIKEDT